MSLVHTIGHSTRPIEGFIGLLAGAAIDLVVDVRLYPASRRHPQFGRAALQQSLAAAGVGYRHEPDLGGRREPRPGSPNTAWGVAAFRGYADHMATPGFCEALARVREDGSRRRPAVMCAEKDPAACHRQLVADALVLAGVEVRHIVDEGPPGVHRLHPAASLDGAGHVVYPARRLF